MYAVVLFPTDNTVDVVPRSWLYGKDLKQCWWPPHKGLKFTNMIMNLEPSQPGWESYDVQLLKETESFERARKACKKAEDGLSDLATSEEDQRRRRKRPKHFPSDHDSSDGGDDEVGRKDLEERKKQKLFKVSGNSEKTRPLVPSWGKGSSANSNSKGRTPSPSPGCSRSMSPLPPSFGKERANSNKEVTNSTSNICNGRSPPPTPGSSRSLSPLPPRTLDMDERLNDGFGQDQYPTDSTERTLKTVLLVLSEIRQQVKQNTLLLKSLKVRQQQQVNVDIDISEDFRLPMESEADVTAVEETLQDKEKSKRLVRHLSTLGGVSSKDVVERIMVAMFSQSLSTIYNWLGKGKLKKHALSQLSIATIIKDAAKQSNVKEADCEAAIKNWLKYASDRDGGRKKRAEKQKERDREQARKFKALNLNLDSSDDEQE
ncbi:uncharacterized protein LOC144438893 isoform X2 [Glandiceps talaboti]